jgi:hypothetical protein
MSSEPPNERLLVARPGAVRVMGARWAFWRAQHGCEAHALSQAETVLLQYAQVFRTEPELLALARDHARMPGEVASATLRRLMDLGIVAELEAFLPEGGEESAPSPPVVVIRTCNRAEALARLIESILAHVRTEGSVREYVVVDDSLDPTARARPAPAPSACAGARPSRPATSARRTRMRSRRSSRGSFRPSAASRCTPLLDPGAPERAADRRTSLEPRAAAQRRPHAVDPRRRHGVPASPPARLGRPLRPEQLVRSGVAMVRRAGCARAIAARAGRSFRVRVPIPRAHAGRIARARRLRPSKRAWARRRSGLASRANRARRGAFTGTYGGITFDSAVYFNTASASSVDELLRAPYRHERLEGDDVWQGALQPRIVPHAMYTPLLLDNRTLRPFAGTFGKSDDTLFLH